MHDRVLNVKHGRVCVYGDCWQEKGNEETPNTPLQSSSRFICRALSRSAFGLCLELVVMQTDGGGSLRLSSGTRNERPGGAGLVSVAESVSLVSPRP